MKNSPSDIVIGLQYGDEGKARVVDMLAENAGVVARFNGGANAGHTIKHGDIQLALRQVPAAVFYPNAELYIGSGCCVNIEKLEQELLMLEKLIGFTRKRLHISSLASVIQPHHILLDEHFGAQLGTTGNGIGPAYADRAMRINYGQLANIHMGDVLSDSERAFDYMQKSYDAVCSQLGIGNQGCTERIASIRNAARTILAMIEHDPNYLIRRLERNPTTVLFEGAQSVMLDVNKGTVPYVTSSHTVAGAAYVGGDLPATYHRSTIGVAKAIMSRVGHGPFVSEFGGKESEDYCMKRDADGAPTYRKEVEDKYEHNVLLRSDNPFEVGKALRHFSGEYGVGTKRPRRVGALDLVQLRDAIKSNGVDKLILTKMDLLRLFAKTKAEKIPLVTGYKMGSRTIDYAPSSEKDLQSCAPIIEECEAFDDDISQVTTFEALPSGAKKVIQLIEAFTNVKVSGIGTGPERTQYINLEK